MGDTVVFHAADVAGEYDSGLFGNHPEQRKKLIQSELGSLARVRLCEVAEAEEDLSLAACVHDERLLQFLASAWARWKHLWTTTTEADRKWLRDFAVEGSEEQNGGVPSLVPLHATPRVDNCDRVPAGVLGCAGFFCVDHETPVTPHLAAQLRSDLALVRRAVDLVVNHSDSNRCVVYAQTTHPGHHAHASRTGGFCFINNVAVAAKQLAQQLDGRVVIIDVDYHCGNGTASIFHNDPSVFFCSLHADPEEEYPWVGFADETGKHGNILNVPIAGGTRWPQYKAKLEAACAKIKSQVADPKALLISLGLDTLEGDPVARPTCRMQLQPEDFTDMRAVFDAHFPSQPLIVFQEGGYKLDVVPKAVANFFNHQ